MKPRMTTSRVYFRLILVEIPPVGFDVTIKMDAGIQKD